MNKKEIKTKLILGILLLLVLISMSTYAYFMVGTTNNFGTKTITGEFDNTGNVTLSTGNNLVLNLTNEQMLEQTSDVTYYASSTGAKTEETIENIGTAQVVGDGTYNCTYKIKVEDKSTTSMYTTFQSMDNKSESQIVLTVNGIDYDFNTMNLFPLTINGIFQNLSQDNPQNITASFKIVNKKEIDQSEIADSDINLSFTVEEFNCNSKTGTDAETLASSGELWSSGLDGDGYRYVGTNPNNYICFGVSDKATCTGNTDAYMYRIIGVFESGGTKYMKLIKKEALNTAYAWDESNSNVEWNLSTLYSALNGSSYLMNTTYMPSGWSDRITNWTWNTVNTKTNESSGPNYYDGVSPSNIYLHENNKAGSPSGGVHGTLPDAKIGLMYASDYALSLGTDAKNMTTGTHTNREKLKTGWIYLWNTNNDSIAPSTYEWTISRYGYNGSNYSAWSVYSGGVVGGSIVRNTNSVRPVFYLNSNEVIASGTGTLSDPYILGA